MSTCIGECGVAEIYVEELATEREPDGSDCDECEDQACNEGSEDSDDELEVSEGDEKVHPPKKKNGSKGTSQHGVSESEQHEEKKGEDSENSDSDYHPLSDYSSAEDEEAEDEILGLLEEEQEDDAAQFGSSEDYSYKENSDDQIVRRKSRWPRYDSKAAIPHFSILMAFRGKEQMKEALIKYGLATNRHLMFPQDEKSKPRAKCSWPRCPWLIYGAKRTKCDWFQVVTFVDDHHCPPRRDNKLVTAKVIADKYENFIKANLTWNVQSLKQTVLKDLFADVTLSKCKRAKALVLNKLFDATEEEYGKVFDYQAELLRSNPGSTIVVALDLDILVKHVFQRFYVCFNACKKGFLAGCRRVIGLDGCFFKGACNGELICAIARDANNQMSPVAWAIVEKEMVNSWEWIKDLCINNDGDGWVFISDQRKGLISAINYYVLKAEHRMCARHIYANWRKKHRDQKMQKMFWSCAKASNREDFNYNKSLLAQSTPVGAKDMMNTQPTHWSRA